MPAATWREVENEVKTASKSALRAPPQNDRNNHHTHVAAPVVLDIPYWGTLGVPSTPTGMLLTSNTAGPLPEAAFLA